MPTIRRNTSWRAVAASNLAALLALGAPPLAAQTGTAPELNCSGRSDGPPLIFQAGDNALTLTRSDVGAAEAQPDPLSDGNAAPYSVTFALCPEAASAFATFSTLHSGEDVTLTVDGEVLISAVLRTPILDGRLMIVGGHDEAEARALVDRLIGAHSR